MLTNLDLTDRELLHAIAASVGPQGYASSRDIADTLGIRGEKGKNGRSPAGQVSSRLSWMRRNGLLERLDPRSLGLRAKERVWIITPFGDEILHGRVNRSVARAIESANPGASVVMMRELVRHAFVEGSFEQATAVRREYLHNVAKRPR